jgi:hypothetical protein
MKFYGVFYLCIHICKHRSFKGQLHPVQIFSYACFQHLYIVPVCQSERQHLAAHRTSDKIKMKISPKAINNINSRTYKIQLSVCQADAKETLPIMASRLRIAVPFTTRSVCRCWGEVRNTVHQPEASIHLRHNHTFSVAQFRTVCLIWCLIIIQHPQ